MGKFCQCLTELSAFDTIMVGYYFSNVITVLIVATDSQSIQINRVFLLHHKKICCGYYLKVPQ